MTEIWDWLFAFLASPVAMWQLLLVLAVDDLRSRFIRPARKIARAKGE